MDVPTSSPSPRLWNTDGLGSFRLLARLRYPVRTSQKRTLSLIVCLSADFRLRMFRIDVIHKVEQYVATHQDQVKAGNWIEGMGWDQNIWDDKVFPSAVGPCLDGLHRNQASS
jgi:hypothetical protein